MRHPGAPGTGTLQHAFDLAGLGALRDAVRGYAHRQRLRQGQVTQLLLVSGELAANSITHGGGRGRLTVWRDGPHLYCRVSDDGPGIVDTAAGTRPPEVTATQGRGLWMCRQVCADLLITGRADGGTDSGTDGGTTVTAVLDLGRAQPHGSAARSRSGAPSR